jgi:flagellar biosynthesis component FlhA
MNRIFKYLSIAALVLLISAPVLFALGRVSLDSSKMLMLIATIIWFGSVPWWMKGDQQET